MDIAITKGQRKIILYAIGGVLIIFIFWGFVYLPSHKQMQKFRSQLDEAEKQLNETKRIKEIKEAISKGYTYTLLIENLKNELTALSKNIPYEQEMALQYISSFARELNLEILSIRPGPKKLLLDKNKNRIKIAGTDCFQLPVHLKLKGGYKPIGEYIKILTEEAPSLIAIENLTIGKSGKQNILTADINLTVYLRSPKTE